MNWRKIFRIPSKAQKKLLSIDKDIILQRCNIISDNEYKEQREAEKSHNDVCPNCHSKKDKIVDKIRQVQGNKSISSTFYLGFGNLNSIINVDTLEVNHCNVCGNEWKKYKFIYAHKTDILRVALKYLAEILEDPKQKECKWKLETIKVFENAYAENIINFYNKNKCYLYKPLKYKKIIKYYKSVYDKNS